MSRLDRYNNYVRPIVVEWIDSSRQLSEVVLTENYLDCIHETFVNYGVGLSGVKCEKVVVYDAVRMREIIAYKHTFGGNI